MKVTCLSSQESLFETRILKRMAEPTFVPPDRLKETLQSPLFLYGSWHETGFWEGLRWLSSIAYSLPFPCIVCPPFEIGQVAEVLGLQVSLSVKAIDTNVLVSAEDDLTLPPGRSALRVQADFGFVGPAGRPFVITQEDEISVVLIIQPKSTATPLILCGARLFSASGLSDEEDRQALFQALVTWATAQRTPYPSAKPAGRAASDLDPEVLKSLCVLLAGTGVRDAQELIAAANSVLGLALSPGEVDTGLNLLAQNELVKLTDGSISVQIELLEQYVQQMGLWPYVRILRRDFARRER
jgi:hypothetical protein